MAVQASRPRLWTYKSLLLLGNGLYLGWLLPITPRVCASRPSPSQATVAPARNQGGCFGVTGAWVRGDTPCGEQSLEPAALEGHPRRRASGG